MSRHQHRTAGSDPPSEAVSHGPALFAEASALVGDDLQETWRRQSRTGSAIVALRGSRGEYVARIAEAAGAERRIDANYAALEALHGEGAIPTAVAAMVPRPVGRGMAAGAPFTLESLLRGRTVGPEDGRPSRERALAAAGSWITEFHDATKGNDVMTPERWERSVAPVLAAVGTFAATAGEGRAFARFRAAIDATCIGRDLSAVRGHGNLWLGNVLFEPLPAVSGVIDWDLYEPEALPLLDLVHLFLRDDALRRGDGLGPAIVRLDRDLERGRGGPREIAIYRERLAVSSDLTRSLLHLYWVSHVAQHVRFASAALTNRRWIERNVRIPLTYIAKVCGAAGSKPQRVRQLLQDDAMIGYVDSHSGSAVLDIAPATGSDVTPPTTPSGDVSLMASDLPASMLGRFRGNSAANDRRHFQRQVADASALPYRDESFDTVLSLGSLDILPSELRRSIVDEMLRVLRPAGTLAVAVANPWRTLGKDSTGLLPRSWLEQALSRSVRVRHRVGMGPPGLGFLSRLNQQLAFTYGRVLRHVPFSLLCETTLLVCEKRDRKP